MDSARGRVVIVGAGLAGVRVGEALRREGHEGEIVLIGREPHLPYDRPPLSKEVLTGAKDPDRITLRSREFFQEKRIELRLGVSVAEVDQSARSVRTDDGTSLGFDHLVAATGLVPRRLFGLDHRDGVHVLRTLDDCLRLRADLRDAGRVIVVGAGFIGCEIAAGLRSAGIEVVLVEPNDTPLQPALGRVVGELVARTHRAHGVDLRTGVGVRSLRREGPECVAVLSDGSRVRGDLVVLGVGSVPCTDWLSGTDLDLSDGVLCAENGRTADPSIWAVGDVARRAAADGPARRVEHWTSAGEQAAAVARGIRGLPQKEAPVDYVWSDQYGVRLQVLGRMTPDGTPHVLIDEGPRFLVVFERGGRLSAVAGRGCAPRVMELRSALAAGTPADEILASRP